MKVSVFKNLYSEQAHTQTVESILDRFATDDRYNITAMAGMSKADYEAKKKSLPGVCFAGVFSKRSKTALIEASGLLILDFDNINVAEYKAKLSKDKNCFACFVSPSAKGVKALIRIGAVASDLEYKSYYDALLKRYPELDQSGKDISRFCFFCYDPTLFINTNAEVLTVTIPVQERKKVTKQIDNVRNDYAVASKACEIIRHAQEGERHTKILRASRLLGGFVASGAISYNEAERILIQEADLVNEDWKDNQKTVADGLMNGMQSPITEAELKQELEKEQSIIKHGKIYYTLADKKSEILELYENGQTKGFDIGLGSIDELFTCKLGTTSYIYGAPYSGKTQFWFWYLIQLSKRHGLIHAIFSPETGSAKEIFAELIQMYAEQDFFSTYNKQMKAEVRDDAMKFVNEHFIVIDPSHKVITHVDFFNYLDEIERVYNTKIHTATIDPFNEFKQDLSKFSNRQDLYLESVLSEVRENARTNNRHNCIITHVQDQQILTANGIRYYPLPTYREIAGGQAWSRKGMSMIAVWRPKHGLCDDNGAPYESNATVIDVQKSKPKGIGTLGKAVLLYNVNKHGYTDEYGKEANTEQPKEKTIIEHKYNANIYDNQTDEECPF